MPSILAYFPSYLDEHPLELDEQQECFTTTPQKGSLESGMKGQVRISIEDINWTLRSQAQNQSNFFYFISTIEPKNVNKALGDESWIVVMQEELNQFVANDVWELVP
ncbi:hypothetical protein Tco_0095960 [Tanacetum coccineum]